MAGVRSIRRSGGQQTHVVTTEAVHAQAREPCRYVAIVHRPGDHAASYRVNPLNEPRVDELEVRPNVARVGELGDRENVDISVLEQNTARDLGRDLADAHDRVVVERVNGAASSARPDHIDHRSLDVRSFDLDVNRRVPRRRGEDRAQLRNPAATIELDGAYFVPRHLGERAAGPASANVGIVMHHDYTVGRAMDIELYRVSAALVCPRKGGEGVLGELAFGASMGDSFHAVAGVWGCILSPDEDTSGEVWAARALSRL